MMLIKLLIEVATKFMLLLIVDSWVMVS